jgi:pteridine reductase
MDLSGATALVTGGARRVGRAIALGLASAGSNLILHYNRSADEAEETAGEARALGAEVRLVSADLGSDPGAVVAGAGDLAPIRVLVNSAADFPADTLLDVDEAGWERTMAINLRGPVFLTQAFARQVPEDMDGAVVNVTDWRTERPYLGHFSYTIAKGALDTFTLAAADALAPRIRVNAVALGAILPPPGKDGAYLERLARDIPLERVGGTDPVVEAVLSLLRNEFITGEVLRVDGGAHLR